MNTHTPRFALAALLLFAAPLAHAYNRVLYEHTGSPVAESIYDIQFAQRAKLLP